MNDKKIIIRNCPAFLDDVQLLEFSEGTCNSLQNHRPYCQDCTDCVIKQIVEYCKTTRDVYCYGQKHNIRWIDANNILKKFEMQEVE